MRFFEGITAEYESRMACGIVGALGVHEVKEAKATPVTIAERRLAHSQLVGFAVVCALGLSTFSDTQPLETGWSQVGAFKPKGQKKPTLMLEARLSAVEQLNGNQTFPTVKLDLRGNDDLLVIEDTGAFRFDTTEWLAKRRGPYTGYLPLEPGDMYWHDVKTVLNRMIHPSPAPGHR